MKKILVHFLKNHCSVLRLYNLFFQIKNKKAFYQENERRKTISFFDYKELARPIPFYPIELHKDSNYYGYACEMKKYAGIDKINLFLEHGLFLGNRIFAHEGLNSVKSVVCMSENRVESFKQNHLEKPIIPVGPYIYYAEPILSETEYSEMKKKLGKVLLVMPVHSGSKVGVSFDQKVLLDFVEDKRKDYDTVLVCLYFREIMNEPQLVTDYEKMGYKVVCAGHWFDLSFVRRLKSIIMLSDYVVSNSHGTNTGFCTCLGKPQTIVKDDNLIKDFQNYYSDEIKKIRDQQVEEIESAFREYSMDITETQKKIVDKYWGVSCIKTPEELYKVFIEIANK